MKTSKMVLMTALAFLPTALFADICSDLVSTYSNNLHDLQTSILAVMSQTTDPAQLDAYRTTYQMKKDMLDGRLATDLSVAHCGGGVPSNPDPILNPPPAPPTPPPPPPPPDPVPPTTPPTDSGNQPPPVTDPGSGGGDGPGVPGQACKDQLDAYADLLKTQHLKQSEMVHRMQAKIQELNCKNYGQWRRTQNDHQQACEHNTSCKKDSHSSPSNCNTHSSSNNCKR